MVPSPVRAHPGQQKPLTGADAFAQPGIALPRPDRTQRQNREGGRTDPGGSSRKPGPALRYRVLVVRLDAEQPVAPADRQAGFPAGLPRDPGDCPVDRSPMAGARQGERGQRRDPGRVGDFGAWREAAVWTLPREDRSLVAIGIDDFLRWKTLGLLSENALSIEQPKRKRGNAGYVDPRKSIAIQLVELAKDDGFVLARE